MEAGLALGAVVVGGGLFAGGLFTGSWLRGAAAEQAERAHGLALQLGQLVRDGLDAQLRDAGGRLAAAERLDAARVAELARLRLALGAGGDAGGGPGADGVLLELETRGDLTVHPARAADAPGGLPA